MQALTDTLLPIVNTINGYLSDYILAVSYTHLDVYKRQTRRSLKARPGCWPGRALKGWASGSFPAPLKARSSAYSWLPPGSRPHLQKEEGARRS